MIELEKSAGRIKRRLIVRKGIEHIALKTEEIGLIFTENKVVFVIEGNTGKKYLVEKNLADLEKDLDPNIFFRANRKYIISLNFIKAFKPVEKVKLQVDLMIPACSHQVIISQKSSRNFKNWIDEA
jgi:DNA-binding LytR/AlgR family response regulator